MSKRSLTLLIEFDENLEKPSWIWDSHINSRPWHGIYIKEICEGDQIKNEDDFCDEEF